MSQQEKEMAEVDPLVDKLQQWNLQSPVVTKPKTVAPVTPPSPPALIDLKQVSIAMPKAISDSKALVEPKIMVVKNGQTNGQNSFVHVSGQMTPQQPSKLPLGDVSNLPPKPQSDTRPTRLFESSMKEGAHCNCTPTLKPQKGLAASRFAPKETESSPFANKFSVNLQIAIHQDFCPLSSKQDKSNTNEGKDMTKVQKALRAEAEPFTPKSVGS